MYIPSFYELEQVTDSRYSLVVLVSKRARKIVEGSDPLIETSDTKPVSVAMEEVMDGSIVYGETMSDKKYKEKIEKEKEEKLEILKNKKLEEENLDKESSDDNA